MIVSQSAQIRTVMFVSMIIGITLVVPNASKAQTEDYRQALITCGAIEDDTERLSCLDALIKAAQADSGQIANKARPEVAETPRTKEQPSTPSRSKSIEEQKRDFGKPKEPEQKEEISDIEAGIERFTQNRTTKAYTIYLDNGQVWRTKVDNRFRLPSKANRAVISKALFGSFNMIAYTESGRKSRKIKVNRIR